jgi:ribosomal protein L17
MARKTITKKLRFEIFKRDSFTCQYCGRAAPDVILQADHIQPVAKDGDTDITNLITACVDCNQGKSDRELSDDTVIRKRKAQLDELQERREQLAMMLAWQKSLANLDDEQAEAVNELFKELVPGYSLNDVGIQNIKKLIKRHGVAEILECVRISASQYLKYDDGKLDDGSVRKAFDYIGKIANNRRRLSEKPYLNDLYYIRGIIRNRMYCNEWVCIDLLERAYKDGYEIDDLKDMACKARNWTQWRDTMEGMLTDG